MRHKLFSSGVVQMMAAVACGIALGHWQPQLGVDMKPLSDGFIRLIGMPIELLIFALVVSGIAGMHNQQQAAKTGGKALLYFEAMTLLSLLLGGAVALTLHPGTGLDLNLSSSPLKPLVSSNQFFIEKWQDFHPINVVLDVIPSTFAGAFVQHNMQQVLLIALLCGIALARSGKHGAPLRELIEILLKVLFSFMAIILKLAPLAAFGAVAFTIGKYGLGSILPLLKFVASLYLASVLFIAVVMTAIARLAGVSLWRLLAYVKDELLLVLLTTSSVAALPGLIAKMEKIGCAPEVVRLVLPAGYSFNLAGTNIYLTLAAIFLAQAQQIDLSVAQLATLLVIASLTSKGATSVTGSAFIALTATLGALQVMPVEGVVLLLGVERLMKCRSLTNVIGNCVACVAIASWEKALDRQALRRELMG
jgi:aerobic C4-dicarboxylate transport protein